ncbi:MAG TPA: hypothetical protein VJ723_07350 [Candidatus Angelobacter sp.]|nr:hypothetical protein [Candidatus Angelobacter sp.]
MRTESNVRDVPALIARLYEIVRALNKLFPDRPFTPDGHLVGSIGEVIAADIYDLTLEKCSNPGFDAKTQTLQTVEIKLTGGNSVSLSSDGIPPEFLIVLKLNTTTGFSEIYNGEFPIELWKRKSASKRKVVSLRLTELKKLKPRQALKAKYSLEELNRLFI